MFHRVSGVVSSQTVVAHVRKATQGGRHTLNCHPFQHGRWVMAHNGDVPSFATVRDELVSRISPRLRGFLLGDTDSEVIFFLFLTTLAERVDPARRGTPFEVVADALRDTVHTVRTIAEREPGSQPALLTLVVTDGDVLLAHQGGKELHWSTWKSCCAERTTCPWFAAECEAPTRTGYVHHLLVSSEPLLGENHWEALAEGQIVGVDAFMRLRTPA
jgi:glutamine amidotransferase